MTATAELPRRCGGYLRVRLRPTPSGEQPVPEGWRGRPRVQACAHGPLRWTLEDGREHHLPVEDRRSFAAARRGVRGTSELARSLRHNPATMRTHKERGPDMLASDGYI